MASRRFVWSAIERQRWNRHEHGRSRSGGVDSGDHESNHGRTEMKMTNDEALTSVISNQWESDQKRTDYCPLVTDYFFSPGIRHSFVIRAPSFVIWPSGPNF